MCTAVILAGGRGRRLGGIAKALLPVGDQRIIDRQLTALRSVADHVAIVANEAGPYSDLGVEVWPDTRPGRGPLGGILTALLSATTSQVLVVAGDMPFLTTQILGHLLEAGRDVDAAVPYVGDRWHPLCASYHVRCMPTIRHHVETGQLKVVDVLPWLDVRPIDSEDWWPIDPDHTALLNVNTSDDYAQAQAIAGGHDPR